MIKCNLDLALTSRTCCSQFRDMMLLVLVCGSIILKHCRALPRSKLDYIFDSLALIFSIVWL